MKKYKLLKDLPTFKAGELFELCNDGLWQIDENGALVVIAYARATLDKFSNIIDEWFEEVKEHEVWKPKFAEEFYSICDNGEILKWVYDDECSKGIIEIGNCFKTREDAEKAVEKLKVLRRLREKGLRFQNWDWDEEDDNSISVDVIVPGIDNRHPTLEQVNKDMDLLFGKEQ